MSLEIVLIPVAIALTKQMAEGVSRRLENQDTVFLLETRMNDEALLKQALEDWDCTYRTVHRFEDIESSTSFDGDEVVFAMNEAGCFTLVLPETADRNAYEEWLAQVEKSYASHLQHRVYQNLIERARSQGLILEQEELLGDRTIQLTYILNR